MEKLLHECQLYGINAAFITNAAPGLVSPDELVELRLERLLNRKKLEITEVMKRLKEDEVKKLQAELDEIKKKLELCEEELRLLKEESRRDSKTTTEETGSSEKIVAEADGAEQRSVRAGRGQEMTAEATGTTSDGARMDFSCDDDNEGIENATGAHRTIRRTFVEDWLRTSYRYGNGQIYGTRGRVTVPVPDQHVPSADGLIQSLLNTTDANVNPSAKEKQNGSEVTEATTPGMSTENAHPGEAGNRSVEGNMFPCVICGMVCQGKRNLKAHMLRSHTNEGGRAFQCPQCPKIYSTSDGLKSHQAICHDRRAYQCRICGKCFATKHYWKGHEALHVPGSQDIIRLRCQFCNKTYASTVALQNHIKQSHLDGSFGGAVGGGTAGK